MHTLTFYLRSNLKEKKVLYLTKSTLDNYFSWWVNLVYKHILESFSKVVFSISNEQSHDCLIDMYTSDHFILLIVREM